MLRSVPATTASDHPSALLRAVGRGDRAAFDALYDELAPGVFGLAVRLVRDPGLAEDVTQEAFIDVWRRAPRFDPARGSARTWVLTIAHRRAVDLIRQLESRRLRESQATAEHEEPEDTASQAVRHTDVHRCLSALTPLQREAVELAYYQGLTYAQVAGRLDRPLPTIKTRMRDGLIRLRDCLGGSYAA